MHWTAPTLQARPVRHWNLKEVVPAPSVLDCSCLGVHAVGDGDTCFQQWCLLATGMAGASNGSRTLLPLLSPSGLRGDSWTSATHVTGDFFIFIPIYVTYVLLHFHLSSSSSYSPTPSTAQVSIGSACKGIQNRSLFIASAALDSGSPGPTASANRPKAHKQAPQGLLHVWASTRIMRRWHPDRLRRLLVTPPRIKRAWLSSNSSRECAWRWGSVMAGDDVSVVDKVWRHDAACQALFNASKSFVSPPRGERNQRPGKDVICVYLMLISLCCYWDL